MTLGDVGKASAGEFMGKRKVLLVPYVVATRDAAELHQLVEAYWREAMRQVRRLEPSLGEVRHLFHEGSLVQGDDAVKALEQGNPVGFPYLKEVVERGAALEPTEDVEALKETLDLHRCLGVVQSSHTVLRRLMEWFEESRKRRYLGIAQRVDQGIEPNGVALLIISPDHQVQFPQDIEVVYVAPPALDKINRWLREHPLEEAERKAEGQPGEGAQAAED